MAFKGLTINTPSTEDPHIYAENDAAIYQAILGDGDMMLNYGDNFSISVSGSTSITVSSGLLAVQGHIGIIEADDSEAFTLENGTAGVTRNDLLVARFETTGTHGTDTFTMAVLKGGTDGSLPAYNTEDLTSGGKKRDFPVAQVTMNGMAISTVTMLETPATCMKDLLYALNERISYGTTTPSGGNDGDIYIMYE